MVGAIIVPALLIVGFGCGDDEVARQQEIRSERAEAAKIAKQEERLRQVEQKLEADETGTTLDEPPTRTVQPQGDGENDSWPSGVAGWTVILGSSQSRSAAEGIATSALNAGLQQVGVLFSSNYSSLNDGYWVTYTGVLESSAEAKERQAAARASGFTDAYAREVAE